MRILRLRQILVITHLAVAYLVLAADYIRIAIFNVAEFGEGNDRQPRNLNYIADSSVAITFQ